MNDRKKLSRTGAYLINAVLLSAVTVAMRAVSVGFSAYVSRKIGSEAVGLFSLVMSIYALGLTLATSGVNLAAVRMVSERKALCAASGLDERQTGAALKAEMRGCIKYSLFFGFFAGALVFILSDVIGIVVLCDARTVPSLKILSLSLPAIALCSALSGYFTGMRKIVKNAAVSIWEQFIRISLTGAAIVMIAPAGIEYALIAVVGGDAVSEAAALLAAYILYKTDKDVRGIKPKKEGGSLRRAAAVALPVAVGSYVRQALVCAEHLAIPAGLKKSGVGVDSAIASYGILHGMAFSLIFFPASVISAFASLLVPELSSFAALGDREKILRTTERVICFSIMFSVGVAAVFSAFGSELGVSLYKSAEAGRYIVIMAPLVPVMYLDTAVDSMLKGLSQQVYCMRVNILDACLSLILVLTLVPRMGVGGYILCVYITEIVNAALSLSKLLSVTGLRFRAVWLLVPAASAALAVSVCRASLSWLSKTVYSPLGILAALTIYLVPTLLFSGTYIKLSRK